METKLPIIANEIHNLKLVLSLGFDKAKIKDVEIIWPNRVFSTHPKQNASVEPFCRICPTSYVLPILHTFQDLNKTHDRAVEVATYWSDIVYTRHHIKLPSTVKFSQSTLNLTL